MKRIELRGKKGIGKFALIDDSDYEMLSKYKWYCDFVGYAPTASSKKLKLQKSIRMHRLIMGNPKNKDVDHINGDRLDNRKKNLRVCSSSQNMSNRNVQSNNKLGVKGVIRNRTGNKFIAQIGYRRKNKFIGVFKTIRSAALAYNRAAQKYHGEFARLNDISKIGA